LQPHAGEVLTKLRTARGLSQNQLAELASVGRATIQKAENATEWRLRDASTRAIIAALATSRPLSGSERDDLKKYCGEGAFATIISAERLADAIISEPGHVAGLNRAIDRFRNLIDRVGAERVADALEALDRFEAGSAPETPEIRPKSAGNPQK
jgi:transcriptional regulator with XRE-family HTH domain